MILDAYRLYVGDGSVSAGWPSIDEWVSFESTFNAKKALMRASCPDIGTDNGAGTTDAEIGQIWNAIQNPKAVFALGLTQDHAGKYSCNVNGVVMDPCPDGDIFGVILEGTAGTASGIGLAGAMNQAGGDNTQTVYRAARIYNPGSMTKGNLDDGRGSTNYHVTDVANRLTGWVSSPTKHDL